MINHFHNIHHALHLYLKRFPLMPFLKKKKPHAQTKQIEKNPNDDKDKRKILLLIYIKTSLVSQPVHRIVCKSVMLANIRQRFK